MAQEPRPDTAQRALSASGSDWSGRPAPFAAGATGLPRPSDQASRTAPAKRIDEADKLRLLEHYRKVAGVKARFRKRNAYYYRELTRILRLLIPEGRTLLEAGCGDGFMLRQLRPRRGLGLDVCEEMIKLAREVPPEDGSELEYRVEDVELACFHETFDYVLGSDLMGDMIDIQQALENLRFAGGPGTRLVLHYHSQLWEPVVKLAEKVGLKTPQPRHNWLNRNDIENLLRLSGFEPIMFDRKMLLPVGIPIVSALLNRCLASLPGLNNLCMVNLIVARPKPEPEPVPYSVSIVIPCRNEKGTIRAAVDRIPEFGSAQEILFVDGHSTDGTPEEIEAVIRENPGRKIRFLRQEGRGKGDAVRLAFDHAANDILMILDADLTVPPEDLPKFYRTLASHKAEFINGSRLIYPMEKQAMRFLNILGNHFFSKALTWLLNQPLKDTLCGTKVLFRKDYLKIKSGRSYFGEFDPFGDFDLLFGAVRQNLKIMEVPVRYRDRIYGTTNISRFRHGFLLLKMVIIGFVKLKL